MNETLEAIRDIQARVGRLFCRVCGHAKLDLVLQCDRHADRCVFLGRCERCRSECTLPERERTVTSGGRLLCRGR